MDFSHNGHLQFAVPTPSPQNGQSPSSVSSRSSDPGSGTGPLPQMQPLPQPPQLSTYLLPHAPHTPAPIFRAPAHKHAHHLHSIPPREKSTRTLIIDHLLWVHARTRFAQARAELAMTDRTGGPGSPNYVHRERPELWDEDEEVPSDSEGSDAGGKALRARSGGPEQSRNEEEEAWSAQRDLPFARRLRQRAEALEKVVTGMLKQPPRDYPFPADEPIAPMPPQQPPVAPSAPAPSPVGKNVLPNGVRLRLVLTTVINDFFSREPPVYRHLRVQAAAATASSSASRSNPGASASRGMARSLSSAPSSSHLSGLPQSLVPLLSVSSAAASVPISSSLHLSSNPTNPAIQQQPFSVGPRSRVRDVFAVSVDRSTSGSPPFVRCPRHLHHACEICVTPGRTAPPHTRSDHRANERTPVAQGWGISGFSESAGVGSGLARPGLGGSLLRRGIPPPDEARDPPGAKNTQLAELIPRFLRLSALVALELGREVGTTASAEDAKALVPTAEWYLLLAGLLTCAVLEGYLTAGWAGLAPVQVLLGVGLGSAGTPEASPLTTNDGYNEFEPDDMPDLPNAVNVLFPSRSVSNSPSGNVYDIAGGASGGNNSTSGGGSSTGRRGRQGSDPMVGGGGGEAEFSHEMGQRVAWFLDVPAGTPNLLTHMEDLAWRYPTGPVERAALRFCEALARWRGKPELETYKKRPPTLDPPRIPTMPEGGIAGGANAEVRQAIGRYFVIPRSTTTTTTTTTTPAPVVADSASSGPAAIPVGDGVGDGRTVGRKRSHSGSGVAAATPLSGSSAGNRWRERRGYV